MFNQKCRVKELTRTLEGEYILSLVVPESVLKVYPNMTGKALRADIKQWREKRSLDANAYFHHLVGKIAEAVGISEEQCKNNLVLDYGTPMRDENGDYVIFTLLLSIDPARVCKYAKLYDRRYKSGREYGSYIAYEHTHNYDTRQMARLIEGTIQEAKELGIETKTPDEITKMVSLWKQKTKNKEQVAER